MWNCKSFLPVANKPQAVCRKCSNYFIKLPELAYTSRVRVCRNCLEQVQYRERERKLAIDEYNRQTFADGRGSEGAKSD